MRKKRSKALRKAAHLAVTNELIQKGEQTNFYRFLKDVWKKGKWTSSLDFSPKK